MVNPCSRWRSIASLAAGLLALGCLEEQLNLPYAGYTPSTLGDGWQVADPEEVDVDAAALERVIRELHEGRYWQMRSLLVIKESQLVAEAYLRDGRDQQQARAVWSVTKQVMALLVGIALDKGVLADVKAPLADCIKEIPSKHPDKKGITLQHLLHMQTGIAYSNDGANGETSQMLRGIPEDSARFILGLPMNTEPGTTSDYHDGNPHLMSICLHRMLERPVDEWAKEVLFDPVGLKATSWRRYTDGTTFGGFGIMSTPRDLAKLGQLVLDNGQVDGEPLLRSEWLTEMTANRVDSYSPDFDFGYWWWIDKSTDLIFMAGHGGQFVVIDRPAESLVVIMSEPNTQGDHQLTPEVAIPFAEEVLSALR